VSTPTNAKGLIEGAIRDNKKKPRPFLRDVLLSQLSEGELARRVDYICALRPGGGGAEGSATVTIPHLLAHASPRLKADPAASKARVRRLWRLIGPDQPQAIRSRDDHALDRKTHKVMVVEGNV